MSWQHLPNLCQTLPHSTQYRKEGSGDSLRRLTVMKVALEFDRGSEGSGDPRSYLGLEYLLYSHRGA